LEEITRFPKKGGGDGDVSSDSEIEDYQEFGVQNQERNTPPLVPEAFEAGHCINRTDKI
jgi:hypothetical protein